MVNENIIPKTETIYELKEYNYEIKTSKLSPAARAKVIKRYGGNYVSENREEYGPCERYCSPKDNPKCTCYINDGYIPLNSACPSCTYAPNTKHQWYHGLWCGGQMYISTSAYIKCMSCSKEMKWREWLFKCDHVDHKTYEEAKNAQLFISALNIASSMHADDSRILQMIAEISYAILKDSLNK